MSSMSLVCSVLVAASALASDSPRDFQVTELRKPNKHVLEKHVLEKEAFEISGYYTCKGQETGGKPYSGVVVITKKNEVYLMQWNCAGSSFLGLGIRQGNILAASWAIPDGGKGMVRGINMYKVEPGPTLVGRWALLPGNGILQNETLTFLRPLDPDD